MTNYLIRRVFQMSLVVVVASFAIYLILNTTPGGPLSFVNQSGDRRSHLSPGEVERLRAYLGLQIPSVPMRWLVWFTGEDWLPLIGHPDWQKPICQQDPEQCNLGVVRLDFGTSWSLAKGQPVSFLLLSRLGNTLQLLTAATVVSLAIAIPAGIYSAVKQYSKFDYAVTSFTYFGTAMPVFWFGLLMIMFFAYFFQQWKLPYMPTGDVYSLRILKGSVVALFNFKRESIGDRAVHLVMPTIVLSLLYMATWGRFMRSSMLEVLRQDFVRTARAKGLIERVVIVKHALRNALIPIITIVVFQIPGIFGGAILTETIFNWKGMGRLYYDALGAEDWPVVMSYLFISAVLVVIASLVGDMLYTVVDPRIRLD